VVDVKVLNVLRAGILVEVGRKSRLSVQYIQQLPTMLYDRRTDNPLEMEMRRIRAAMYFSHRGCNSQMCCVRQCVYLLQAVFSIFFSLLPPVLDNVFFCAFSCSSQTYFNDCSCCQHNWNNTIITFQYMKQPSSHMNIHTERH